MLKYIVVFRPSEIFKAFTLFFWISVPFVISIIGYVVYDNYNTEKILKNAKPYQLPIDKKTGYPTINMPHIKSGQYNFQSPSFFVSTKNGVFLMTDGILALVRYENIAEDLSKDSAIKGAKTFRVQVEEFRGYIPESCKAPILENLELRHKLISGWMNEKKGSNFTYLEGTNHDIPKLDSLLSICPTYFGLTGGPLTLVSAYVQYIPDQLDKSTSTLGAPDFLGIEKNWCVATQSTGEWIGEKCSKTNVFLEGVMNNKNGFIYRSNKDQAEILNRQFADYLAELKN